MAEDTQARMWKNLDLTELRFALTGLIDYWKDRNTYIAKVREALEGANPIVVPTNTHYQAQTVHLYSLTSILNEKISRYLSQPSYQVIIDDPTDTEEVDKSSRLEKALNVASYEMERLGDGDVWNRVIIDAILLDEGVEKIECAPAAFWRELVDDNSKGAERYPMQSTKRDQYKKQKGLPLRKLYVPLENFLPSYDGPTLDFSFELEGRTLYSCKKNKLFAKDAFDNVSDDTAGGRNTIVPIWHYCDDEYYAYFTTASNGIATTSTSKSLKIEEIGISELKPLYIYRHGIGRSIYNPVAGRFGGWKTSTNRIEGVNKGVLSLNQLRDELASQMYTNIRATKWQTFKFIVNPELRGVSPGSDPPAPPAISEGGYLPLFDGEDLIPIVSAQEDPSAMFMLDLSEKQMYNLGGSPVLFGQRQPGVDTGYHNAQQVSQAEHLDEKVEQHAVQGAIIEATIMLLHVRNLGEKTWCHYTQKIGNTTRKSGEYVYLDPDDLDPLPRIDARVRKPRPIDFIASIRAGRDASDERQGKGPLLSTQTIRTEILARESPDEEEALVRIESEKNKLLASGVISNQIAMRLNLSLASKTPQPSGEQVAGANSAVLGAVQQLAGGQAAGAGGINPDTLAGTSQKLNMPDGGMEMTDSQPEARLGESVASAMGGRP